VLGWMEIAGWVLVYAKKLGSVGRQMHYWGNMLEARVQEWVQFVAVVLGWSTVPLQILVGSHWHERIQYDWFAGGHGGYASRQVNNHSRQVDNCGG